jgi:hypothetical protein
MVSVSDGVIFVEYARTVGVVGIDKAKPKEHARITKRVLIAMEGPRDGLRRVEGFYPIAIPRIECIMRQHSLFSAEDPDITACWWQHSGASTGLEVRSVVNTRPQ